MSVDTNASCNFLPAVASKETVSRLASINICGVLGPDSIVVSAVDCDAVAQRFSKAGSRFEESMLVVDCSTVVPDEVVLNLVIGGLPNRAVFRKGAASGKFRT